MRVRLPLRIRLLVTAVVVVLVAGVGAGVAAVQYGAHVLAIGGGYTQSIRSTSRPVWIGFELENSGALPVTVRGFVPRGLQNLRILDERILDTHSGVHLGMLTEPDEDADGLIAELHAAVPVDGFVVPAGDLHRYQLVVRVRRIVPGEQSALVGGAIAYSVLGLDQGVTTDGVSCIRAHGAQGCPPY